MAKFSKGILGGFSGKVGNVVGSSWKGIDYMRSKPNKVNNPKTEAQLEQRQRFRLIMGFIRMVRPVIDIGFSRGNKGLTPSNRASSYNLKNGITGTYPDLELDFERVLISRGDLTGVSDAAAVSTTPLEITFSWTDNSGAGSAKEDDIVMLVVYNSESDEVIYRIADATRQDETYALNVPDTFEGKPVECYLAMASADQKTASDSQYLGQITVTATP